MAAVKKRSGRVRTAADVMARVSVSFSGCWYLRDRERWTYQMLWTDRGNEMAHRVSYRILRGEFDEALEIDHLCRNKACVNPAHLEPVTKGVNMSRRHAFRAAAGYSSDTECSRGKDRPGYLEALDRGELWAVEASRYDSRFSHLFYQ